MKGIEPLMSNDRASRVSHDMRGVFILAALASLGACQPSRPAPHPTPRAPAAAAPAQPPPAILAANAGATAIPVVAPADASAPSNNGALREVDLHGVTLAYLSGGQLRLYGSDLWSHPFDTVYESETFFRGAVPAIERSITPEQGVALRQHLNMPPAPPARRGR